jgi:hypothetical protein
MGTLTRVTIALALIGLVLFGTGVRLQSSEVRWIGLGFVALAWSMRFLRPRSDSETTPPAE